MSVMIQEGQYGLLWIHSTNLWKYSIRYSLFFTILSVMLKGDVIRHYLWWNRKCYLWVSIKTPNHHQSWLQFSLSLHTLQHTNSITNPLLAQINETLRQTVASCTNVLAGGGGGGGGGGIHVRLSAPGFGAHRICACADTDFHFFFVCLFHRGAHMLRSLTSFFFLMENYSTCINRMTRKSLP